MCFSLCIYGFNVTLGGLCAYAAETVRRHNIQYPEHDVASCRRLYAKHALEQGNRGWWAVAESHLISGVHACLNSLL
jgi:hypothetical protein